MENKMEIINKDLMEMAKATWIKRKHNIIVPNNIIIKVTPHCNLNCVYCYSNNNEEKCSHIEPAMVETLFDQLFDIGNRYRISCVFHGGEPMLYIDTLKEIISTLKSKYYYERINFEIQTNGTLISNSTIDFISENFTSVGLSLDGVGKINDKTRKYHNDRGSFQDISNGINMLAKHGIGYGILAVATRENIDHLVELVKWCSQHDIYSLGIEPLLFCGRGEMCRYLDVSAEEYWEGMRKLVDYLLIHNQNVPPDKRIYVRDFETVARKILGEPCTNMCSEIPCGAGVEHISLNYDGKVYICDSFTNIDDYCIGNITNQKLSNMLEASIIKKFANRNIEGIDKCRDCQMKRNCLFGCIGKTILGNSISFDLDAVSPLCYYYYSIAEYLEKILVEQKVDPTLLIKQH